MSERPLVLPRSNEPAEVELLRARVARLEARIDEIPRTMLLSRSFMARAFAVLGHYLVAGLIIALPFYVLMFFFALLVGCLS